MISSPTGDITRAVTGVGPSEAVAVADVTKAIKTTCKILNFIDIFIENKGPMSP
jgi:hypothetical protein